MLKRAALVLLAGLVPSAAWSQALHLVCSGEGEASRVRTTTAYGTNSHGESGTATIYRRESDDFSDQVNVEIEGGRGRIRLPRTMLPPIHGGDNGWMRLTDIRTTDSEITASARVNFMSRPRVRIDRITGAISISGRIGHYAGQCEAYDPATVPRRF